MRAFAERLLAWFDREQRDLPWRHSRDPWAIWISEIMLQQTRVEVVRLHYERFLARYPDPGALATATDDELLSAWRGLGYYRRARMLRDAARAVVEHHGGEVPSDPDALGELPGVGRYTQGAIASIAFGRPLLAVDGNVERVTARHRAIRGPLKTGPAARQVRDVVGSWLDTSRPGDFNQALMELGAVICTPRSPRCADCPVADDCAAREAGIQDQLPEPKTRRAFINVATRAVIVPVSGGRILGSRIPEGEVNAGQIDLPGPGSLVASASVADLEEVLERRYGVEFRVREVITTVRHGITHHRILLRVHRAECARGPGPNLMAVRPDDARVPWTTIARKAFRQAALFLSM